jgi:hypothetical protein
MPIPDPEFELYVNSVATAEQCALCGLVRAGFRELARGLEHARAAGTEREAWAADLVTAYQVRLDRYTAEYGAKLLE